ncbi:uncharacterized protein LOC132245644 isoform X3 [Alligator mississippiensis]|uniref:uncharacterized protein LOC132245644 isoform X3 n=1 Tax=Alligator mississippiensis TaxID=8496 RepID=UPI0028775BD7|nr:uncharacterized protein LOC132245644 isoform X3 [Alligator mississippiensis]
MPGSVHRPRAGTQTVLLPEIPCQGQCTRDPQYTMCNAPSPLDLAECGHIQGIWQCCTESQRGKTSSHSRVCWSRLNQGEDEDGGSLGPLNQVTPTRTAQPRLTTSRSNTQSYCQGASFIPGALQGQTTLQNPFWLWGAANFPAYQLPGCHTAMEKWNQRSKVGCPRPQGNDQDFRNPCLENKTKFMIFFRQYWHDQRKQEWC